MGSLCSTLTLRELEYIKSRNITMNFNFNDSLVICLLALLAILREGLCLKCWATPKEKLQEKSIFEILINEPNGIEPKEMECQNDEDICINVETTLDFKIKGCAKLGELERLPPDEMDVLNAIEIKKDECKKIPVEVNNMIKSFIDFHKFMLNNVKEKKERENKKKELESIDGFEAHTLCTCSSDLCNAGVQIEAKSFMVVLFSLIISKLFMG